MSTAVARKLDNMKEKGALNGIDVANLLAARPETVSRWKTGKVYPHQETEKRLLGLDYIIEQLSDFYDPQDARQWIFSRQKLLDDQAPADLIQQGQIDEVIQLINQIRDGVYM